MKVNLKSIPFQKYKRVFAFGCSFTEYKWPTWANVLQFEMPQAEFYNWAKVGGGNLYITSTLMSVNQKYTFTSEDLILIMWSTHCREDRYIKSGWLTPGNIYTQNYYSEDFVKQFSCAKGYLLRDLSLITATKFALDSMPSDYLMLRSVEANWDSKYFDGDDFNGVIELYKNILEDFPPVLYDSVKDGTGGWINGHEYDWPDLKYNSPKFLDYHPNPEMYMQYLLNIGINISEKTQMYVRQLNQELKNCKNEDDINRWWRGIYQAIPNYHSGMHLI